MDVAANWALAHHTLALAGAVVDGIQQRCADWGFDDVRPAHGFVFVRLSEGAATATELAEYLGVTKQAASQLVEELVAKGYVRRRAHPTDARARLVVLTDRGQECTRAAVAGAAETVQQWATTLGEEKVAALGEDLGRIVPPGRIRPVW
ncbi:DNA-binding MarR family transcriptional regulator [Lipingzhangella halophila]|uniref:DNA-binding MarR family transcriptional regulator n=1 Tax=Lipingzhangella halophila TaxID=1783352 RepID=A0A7W7W2K1_9ACTN|nr:MarR family winged helix-turn-helix transcriptional regulator [Lipingzhangella halophila]MBB4930869.1 DNA-binding MarR family transcriptional regulator [Lipingzhangella halophila]